nr:hypothetical protein BaRGS_018148 [Batillaria attramentaria]
MLFSFAVQEKDTTRMKTHEGTETSDFSYGNDQDTQDNEPDEDVVKIEETSELLRNSKYVKNASSEESLVVQLVKDTKDESLLETCVTEDPVRDGETPVQIQTDGGWGWVVCMASLIANGIVNATINTFGILYVALVKEFADNDRDKAFKSV